MIPSSALNLLLLAQVRVSKQVFPPDDENSWFSKKRAYLEHAWEVSHLMEDKSTFDGIRKFFEDLLRDSDDRSPRRRVQSHLGGGFLRMYLKHKVDPELVRKAGLEIGQSKEFTALQSKIASKLQGTVQKQRREPNPDEIGRFYTAELNRKMASKDGLAFRDTLNTVVGGATASVNGVRILSRKADPKEIAVDYQVDIVISDTYDFANHRTGQYETYRQRLAHLLVLNNFKQFEKEYHDEILPFRRQKTSLDHAALFASFMFALERKGWTPGPLSWSVTIPMAGTLIVPARK